MTTFATIKKNNPLSGLFFFIVALPLIVNQIQHKDYFTQLYKGFI